MAKKDKAAKEAPVETKAKTEAKEFKFGVADLAEKLDIKEASVRVQLRNKGIPKAGKSYGWDTKAELDEVVSQLKATDDAPAAKGGKKGKDAPAAAEPEAKGKKKKK